MSGPSRPAGVQDVCRRIVTVGREFDFGLTAAALSYYSLLAIVPAFVLFTGVLTALWGEAVATATIREASTLLSPEAQAMLWKTLSEKTVQWQASVGSAVVLLWALVRLFRALDQALANIYQRQAALRKGLIDGAVAMSGVAVAVFVIVGARATVALFQATLVGPWLVVGRFAVVSLLLFPLYYVLPNADLTVTDALPGTFVAAGGWEVLRYGFDLYLKVLGTSRLSGILGTLVVFVTWLFFGNGLVLVGGLVNAVLSGER